MTPKLKVTASSRGGVGSNRKRTGSPQDNELDSAGCDDEPACSWRSPEIVQHAGNGGQSDAEAHHVVGGGMLGSLCEISGETCRRGGAGRSQNLRSTEGRRKEAMAQTEGNRSSRAGERTPPKACPARSRGAETKPRRGKGGRKVDGRRLERGTA